ncbi:hypothetical protein F4782DRAFT_532143 [Xylaria castorea]|nr:hypothetical protein F4782DRAFT_532143 [Xylaria castorea]
MADLPAPVTSFPQFTRLPRELRDMIWRFCLSPRIVEVRYLTCFLPPPSATIDENRLNIKLALPVKPPLITRVCRESRREALRCAKYKGERPTKLPRRPNLYDGPKPRKRAYGHLWFNKNTDVITFNARPWELLSRSLWPNNNNNSDSNDDREIAPELRELLSDPNVPLCINYDLHENGRPMYQRPRYWKAGFVEWALKYIANRKECTVVIALTRLDMTYQEACESELFGCFAEAEVVHIDVNDDIRNRKLQAVEKFGKMQPWKSGSLRDYIQGPDVRKDISTFLKDIWLLWLKKEKLLPRNLKSLDLPLSTQAALSVERLPKFNFVISVRLHVPEGGKIPYPGDVDMGFFQFAH